MRDDDEKEKEISDKNDIRTVGCVILDNSTGWSNWIFTVYGSMEVLFERFLFLF